MYIRKLNFKIKGKLIIFFMGAIFLLTNSAVYADSDNIIPTINELLLFDDATTDSDSDRILFTSGVMNSVDIFEFEDVDSQGLDITVEFTPRQGGVTADEVASLTSSGIVLEGFASDLEVKFTFSMPVSFGVVLATIVNRSLVVLDEFSENIIAITVDGDGEPLDADLDSVYLRSPNFLDGPVPVEINFNASLSEFSFVYIGEPGSFITINGFDLQ